MASDLNPEERLRAALVGRYSIEGMIGSGGMATVFLAHDQKHGRRVALKVFDPQLARTVGADRFFREVKTVAGFSHPHILPLFDSGEADGLLFFVMPFVEGESLRDRLAREGRLSIPEAIRIAVEVAGALAYAHERGVVHRDVKPANILLESGHAVLADFGIARVAPEVGEEQITQTGTSLGTPSYMSPEQAVGEEVDGRSDQYALACVLFEMLVGEPPFTGATPQVVWAKLLSDQAPSVSIRRKASPAVVNRAIARALSKAPEDRFPSVKAFVEAMTETGPSVPTVRRWALPLFLICAALLMVWGVIEANKSDRGSVGDLRVLAVLPCENRTGDSTQNFLATGIHEEIVGGLERAPGVEVRGRSSVMRYPATDLSRREIARELGVEGLVDCSISKNGDSVRVLASLHDEEDNEAWSDDYLRLTGEEFRLGGDVALGIMTALRGVVTSQESALVKRQATQNQEALTAYHRGRALWGRWEEEALERSRVHFETAIDLDSTFALAYTGLAEAIMSEGDVVAVPGDMRPVEYMGRVRELVQTALTLDPYLSEGHRMLGWIRMYYDYDYPAALREIGRAVELDSVNAAAWAAYGLVLSVLARHDEGIQAFQRATQLEPAAAWILSDYSWMLILARRFEESLGIAAQAIDLDPTLAPPFNNAGDASLLLGDYEQAIEYYQVAIDIEENPWHLSLLSRAQAMAGNRPEALRILNRIEAMRTERYVGARPYYNIYLGLDSLDAAIDWYIRAAEAREPGVNLAIQNPLYGDRLRSHPRFPELLRLLNREDLGASEPPVGP